MQERRKIERIPLNIEVEVFLLADIQNGREKIDKIINCKCLNISTGGVLINKSPEEYGTGGVMLASEVSIPKDRLLIMGLHLDMEFFNLDITVRGKVVESLEHNGEYYANGLYPDRSP